MERESATKSSRTFKEAAVWLARTATIGCLAGSMALSQNTQTVETRIGKLDFELGVPTQATVTNLYDPMDFQRACQLYLWALPLVDFGHLQAILEGTTGALPGDVAIYMGYD